jgi:hypothetical protein
MRLRLRIAIGLTIGLALGSACADGKGRRTCRSCDDDELCARYGSDISGEPDTYACEPWPNLCADDPTCACLAADLDALAEEDSLLHFCVTEGACQAEGDTILVTCPGG